MFMFLMIDSSPTTMKHEEDGGSELTKIVAVAACTAMGVFYVVILYVPTLVLRLPPPNSHKSFLIRRFVCAGVSSIVSLIICAFILPVRRLDLFQLFGVYGIRMDYIWQALVGPLLLTSCMYTGSLSLKILSMVQEGNEHSSNGGNVSDASIESFFRSIIDWSISNAFNVSSWHNYFVAPLTEELVFRACMIPLLLCGGFNTYTVIFLCPVFFNLAHLHHLLELYYRENCSLIKACTIVGFQLGYTVIFGAYASFLFVRTGHVAAPLIAHMICNFMGLPVIISRKSVFVSMAFLLGLLRFVRLLSPITSPHFYNDQTDNCKCWHRYCDWS